MGCVPTARYSIRLPRSLPSLFTTLQYTVKNIRIFTVLAIAVPHNIENEFQRRVLASNYKAALQLLRTIKILFFFMLTWSNSRWMSNYTSLFLVHEGLELASSFKRR